jgi:GMP synthase (glutamine-hydrolysing)
MILIDHHENQRDDRAAIHLSSKGFELEQCCPFMGDVLPEIDHSIGGAVIYGGEQNVTEIDEHPFLQSEAQWIKHAVDADLPLLGICLGAQLIAHSLGANVRYHEDGLCEFGFYEVRGTENAEHWFPESMLVAQAHFQHFDFPEGAIPLAVGGQFPNQAFRYNDNVFALQFHPEVTADIFLRWQESDWAYFDSPGAQTRAHQDTVKESADKVQGDWFSSFLDKVFNLPTASACDRNTR